MVTILPLTGILSDMIGLATMVSVYNVSNNHLNFVTMVHIVKLGSFEECSRQEERAFATIAIKYFIIP